MTDTKSPEYEKGYEDGFRDGCADTTRYYVVDIWGCVDPSLSEPFQTADERDEAAKAVRGNQDEEDSLFWLDVGPDGVKVGAYNAGFFMDDDPATDPYEAAARAAGWTRGGDCGGVIYHTEHYGSWKEAISWAGDGGPNDSGPVYDTWEKCCESEDIIV